MTKNTADFIWKKNEMMIWFDTKYGWVDFMVIWFDKKKRFWHKEPIKKQEIPLFRCFGALTSYRTFGGPKTWPTDDPGVTKLLDLMIWPKVKWFDLMMIFFDQKYSWFYLTKNMVDLIWYLLDLTKKLYSDLILNLIWF